MPDNIVDITFNDVVFNNGTDSATFVSTSEIAVDYTTMTATGDVAVSVGGGGPSILILSL